MPQLYPDIEQINQQKVPPTAGEETLIDNLNKKLDDKFEIFFQPYLNADNPDFVIVKKMVGVWIVEVKDWNLQSYAIQEKGWKGKKLKLWSLSKDGTQIKSPINQVNDYYWNMVNLHIQDLKKYTYIDKKYYRFIHRCIFFSKESTDSFEWFVNQHYSNSELKYLKLMGHDGVNKFINELNGLPPDIFFRSQFYESIRTYLMPPIHRLEEGIDIQYSDAQKKLIESDEGVKQKIKGLAGSGKTIVLAKRAVNAYTRTKSQILILTFNISLVNYIHDKISEVKENFPWKEFLITNYHQFFKSSANNYGIPINSLNSWQDANFFDGVKSRIKKYDAIFIDEVQDYRQEWLDVIFKYFMNDNCEYVVFGDEKQNIYKRKMGDDKYPIIRSIPGRWNKSLNINFRFSGKILDLAIDFQKEILVDKYETDEAIINPDPEFDFETKIMEYHYLEEIDFGFLYDFITNLPFRFPEEIRHRSDIGVLSPTFELLRELDYLIRTKNATVTKDIEKTTTTFETKEVFDLASKEIWERINRYKNYESLSEAEKAQINNEYEEKLKFELETIRRGKKVYFFMKTGLIKMSSIHSFKGWEIPSLVLLIYAEDSEDEFATSELIYTGLTRARYNLFVINIGNKKYHSFFKNKIPG